MSKKLCRDRQRMLDSEASRGDVFGVKRDDTRGRDRWVVYSSDLN